MNIDEIMAALKESVNEDDDMLANVTELEKTIKDMNDVIAAKDNELSSLSAAIREMVDNAPDDINEVIAMIGDEINALREYKDKAELEKKARERNDLGIQRLNDLGIEANESVSIDYLGGLSDDDYNALKEIISTKVSASTSDVDSDNPPEPAIQTPTLTNESTDDVDDLEAAAKIIASFTWTDNSE